MEFDVTVESPKGTRNKYEAEVGRSRRRAVRAAAVVDERAQVRACRPVPAAPRTNQHPREQP
jgi:hypothetical protein